MDIPSPLTQQQLIYSLYTRQVGLHNNYFTEQLNHTLSLYTLPIFTNYYEPLQLHKNAE